MVIIAKIQEAQELVKYYFDATNRRATKPTYTQALMQSRQLLDYGFSIEEIKQGIDWCIKFPPPKGFLSLGWLSYDLENILEKIKIQKIKEEQKNNNQIEEINTDINHKQVEKNNVSGFNFDLFKGE